MPWGQESDNVERDQRAELLVRAERIGMLEARLERMAEDLAQAIEQRDRARAIAIALERELARGNLTEVLDTTE